MNGVLKFFLLLFVMAGVTYLIRLLPLLLVKKQLQNRFLVSFLYYVPYAVLAAMTIPDVFYSTGDPWSAIVGIIVALLLAFFEKSLLAVSLISSGCALVVGTLIHFLS